MSEKKTTFNDGYTKGNIKPGAGSSEGTRPPPPPPPPKQQKETK